MPNVDARLDLVLTRIVNVAPEALWRGWTEPELLRRWFAPHPWTTTACELELRPGGRFHTVMRSPEGEAFPSTGCFLELAEPSRIVFTDALGPDFRPSASPFFTAVLCLERHPSGTEYTAIARHKDEADRKTHEEMGFLDGWAQCLEQLLEVVRALPDTPRPPTP